MADSRLDPICTLVACAKRLQGRSQDVLAVVGVQDAANLRVVFGAIREGANVDAFAVEHLGNLAARVDSIFQLTNGVLQFRRDAVKLCISRVEAEQSLWRGDTKCTHGAVFF